MRPAGRKIGDLSGFRFIKPRGVVSSKSAVSQPAVARLSAATPGTAPAYRCAHAGYEPRYTGNTSAKRTFGSASASVRDADMCIRDDLGPPIDIACDELS